MKNTFGLCFIFLSAGAVCRLTDAHAQVTVVPENAITTDSVDLFTERQGPKQSPTLAMAASLLLPGSGHQYLERDRSALAYFSADALAFFAFFFCDHYAKKIALDATGYAWSHSGARGSVSYADDTYWNAVGKFMDVQEYNTVMDLNRTPEKKIADENLIWHWDDKSSQDSYNAMRSTSRAFRVASSFCIGALVLNRVIAFIDIRTFTRKHGIKKTSGHNTSLLINPSVAVTPSSIDLSLSGSF